MILNLFKQYVCSMLLQNSTINLNKYLFCKIILPIIFVNINHNHLVSQSVTFIVRSGDLLICEIGIKKSMHAPTIGGVPAARKAILYVSIASYASPELINMKLTIRHDF